MTGATGFIGSHLVPVLLRRGYDVTCVVRDPARATALAKQGVALAQGDVTDRQSLVAPMGRRDRVFHVAGWYALGHLDEAKMETVNVAGTRNALGVAADLNVPRIVHTSTVGVFGNTHGDIAANLSAPKTAFLPLMSARSGRHTMKSQSPCSELARL